MTVRSALLVSLFAVACREAAPPVILRVVGRANDNATIASKGDFVAVAWTAAASGAMDVFAAVSRDGGATFGVPVRVNEMDGDARASGEQPPQVALVSAQNGTPLIDVVWGAKRPEGSRLLIARSTDGGASFGATQVVAGSEAAGNRGWQSVTVDDASGNVGVLWLDHRNVAPTAGGHHHGTETAAVAAVKPDPNEKAEQSQIMFARSGDAAPRSVSSSVCYCCKTSVVSSGTMVYAAWRHVFAGSQRDIAMSVSNDAGATFDGAHRVAEDHWAFDGCPENGPSMAIDRSGRVHVFWPTPLDGSATGPLTLFHATTTDGVMFTPREQVPARGAAFHVRATRLNSGAVGIVWEEANGGERRVSMARVESGAAPGSMRSVAIPGDPVGTYPVITATTQGAVVAWVARSGATSAINIVRIPEK